MRTMLDHKKNDLASVEESEGGRRPNGDSSTGAAAEWPLDAPPDPEVDARPKRRTFTAEYKLKVLEEADMLEGTGRIGALLRREGLYSSHLAEWRKARKQGTLGALSPKKRGPAPSKNPLADEVTRLERECERLKKQLSQAQTIIDVQKKVSGLLGIDLASPEPEEKSS